MLKDYTVNVTYKNRALQSVNERCYPFDSYCQEQRFNITKTLNDVEHAFCELQCGKVKQEWPKDVLDMFQRIRNRMLDSANNIGRLPQNLCCNGVNINSLPQSEYFANVIADHLK